MKRTVAVVVGALVVSACNSSSSEAPAGPVSSSMPGVPSAGASVASAVPAASARPLPRGPRAYVSNEGSGDVTVIDLGTGAVVATVKVGKRPRGIQRATDGKV